MTPADTTTARLREHLHGARAVLWLLMRDAEEEGVFAHGRRTAVDALRTIDAHLAGVEAEADRVPHARDGWPSELPEHCLFADAPPFGRGVPVDLVHTICRRARGSVGVLSCALEAAEAETGPELDHGHATGALWAVDGLVGELLAVMARVDDADGQPPPHAPARRAA